MKWRINAKVTNVYPSMWRTMQRTNSITTGTRSKISRGTIAHFGNTREKERVPQKKSNWDLFFEGNVASGPTVVLRCW
jgi:hypothetical protein